ncbi:hypothetical protein TNCV_1867091 [Trichonephila clavipes]|nr:hypothetical protein TNCV_1867091 [Trichonephila clavipes]
MPSPVQSNCDAHDTIAIGQYGAVWSMGHTQQDTFEQLKKCLAAGFEFITSNCLFERGRIVGLTEGGWANWRITHHMGGSDAAIRRSWQEWVDNGKFQGHDGSG